MIVNVYLLDTVEVLIKCPCTAVCVAERLALIISPAAVYRKLYHLRGNAVRERYCYRIGSAGPELREALEIVLRTVKLLLAENGLAYRDLAAGRSLAAFNLEILG